MIARPGTGDHDAVERLTTMLWNERSRCRGIADHDALERAITMPWNRRSPWAGTRIRIDQVDAAALAVGERVRIAAVPTRWLTSPDRVIQRVAAGNRGIYSAAGHLQDLRAQPVLIGGRPVSPQSIVEVNMRRLKRLERFKLAKPLGDGQWQVPANLADILRDRERTHPQVRIQIERLDRSAERPVTPTRNRGPGRGRE